MDVYAFVKNRVEKFLYKNSQNAPNNTEIRQMSKV